MDKYLYIMAKRELCKAIQRAIVIAATQVIYRKIATVYVLCVVELHSWNVRVCVCGWGAERGCAPAKPFFNYEVKIVCVLINDSSLKREYIPLQITGRLHYVGLSWEDS